MRHCRADYDAIQPWPVKRPHVAKVQMKTDGPFITLQVAESLAEANHVRPLIPNDEPVFLIRAVDLSAREVVTFWASLNREHGADPALCDRVARWAAEMGQYGDTFGAHIPDTPEGWLKP